VVLELTRKRVKHLRLSVHPPVGAVRVSAPLRMSSDTIRSFVLSRLDWIRRQQQALQASERPASWAYLDGERHLVWGQPYPLVVVEQDARPVVELKDGTLHLRVRPGSSARQRHDVLTGWRRFLIETTAPPLVARWEPLMRVTVARLSARPMKTRWGSCTPRTRQIRLSTELAKKPPECLEYVVVHEMVHLLEASHNRRFVRLMDQFLPGWRARRAELNGPGTRG
jgi:predicted metal-dependent hydrolase